MMRPHQRKKMKEQIKEGWVGRRLNQLEKNKKNCQRVKEWKAGLSLVTHSFERSIHLEGDK